MLSFRQFLRERTLTGREKSKKEEIVLSLKKKYPEWSKEKIYAIATSTAKKAINETFINSEGCKLIKNKLIQRFDPEAVTPNESTANNNIKIII